MAMEKAQPGWRNWMLVLLVAASGAAVLYAMGRLPICECGTVKLWHGEVFSSENSQHLTDWYSPTHVLHGVVFYLVLHSLASRWSIGSRLVIAAMLETAWEIAENSQTVIERYREVTISLDYYGDSIINSMADIVMMSLGFMIAARVPPVASVGLFIATELFLAWMIRDGLTLNVVMLLWPVDAIRIWQGGG